MKLRVFKGMGGSQKSSPECVHSSNPFHVCSTDCLERIAQAEGRKNNRKILGSILSFGRKKKGSDSLPMTPRNASESQPVTPRNGFESQPMTPRKGTDSCSITPPALDEVPAKNAANMGDTININSVHSHNSFNGKNGEPYASIDHKVYSRDRPFEKAKYQSSLSMPTSWTITVPDHPKDASRDSKTFVATATPAAKEMDKKLGSSSAIGSDTRKFISGPVVQSSKPADCSDPSEVSVTFRATATPSTQDKDAKDMRENTSDQNARSLNFTFSGISRGSEDSDGENVQPETSHALVGKYHVKPSVASILRSIIDRHGDIAANCQLESASMRAYYLESVCCVVQELRFASYTQIPKSKVKGMLAVLKDVGSVNIDVSWLNRLLNEIMEAKELVSEHHAVEAAKAQCDSALESTRKELQSLMEELARKEKELAEARARVAETKARSRELELEFSQLSETMSSIQSKVEKFRGKSLEDQLL